MELTAGTFRAELHDVVAGNQHIVSLHVGRGSARAARWRTGRILVSHIRDGKIVQVWQYIENQYTYDEFFS